MPCYFEGLLLSLILSCSSLDSIVKILTSSVVPLSSPSYRFSDQSRKELSKKSLSFQEFTEKVLYGEPDGYYRRCVAGRDYATSARISPVFGFALARLVSEFASRIGDDLFGIVDIGCGDGSLLNRLFSETPEAVRRRVSLWGVDRASSPPLGQGQIAFLRTIDQLPKDIPLLVFSNELFDALPFARLVQRERGLQELHVIDFERKLEWCEQAAPNRYLEYFASRCIELQSGQFADVSLEWSELYGAICELANVAMVVTFDYGFAQEQLFDFRFRRFGTAAAYYRHRVSRDLLARPGEQDLTAHVNFTDLMKSGEGRGFATLAFLRQAEFLLRIGIAEHHLLAAAPEVKLNSMEEAIAIREQRESARRLVLPDGIGEDIHVLIQVRGIPLEGWSFQRRLWGGDATDSD